MSDQHQTRLGEQDSMLSMHTVRHVTAEELGLPLPAEDNDTEVTTDEWERLYEAAMKASSNADDSVRVVGCAILTDTGTVYASPPIRIGDEVVHAIRSTVMKAVSVNDNTIEKVAIYGEELADIGVCGACCHTLYEVTGIDVDIELVAETEVEELTLQDLYPRPHSD